MESPPYLVDQYAKARGINTLTATRGMMLAALAGDGRTLADSYAQMHISKAIARTICRRLLIDFPDYRPYARLEAKGLPRPEPVVRADLSADGLPLFGEAP